MAMFNEIELGSATGFFIRVGSAAERNYLLITNWHVLSGREANHTQKPLHAQAALPNRIKVSFPIRSITLNIRIERRYC